MTDTTASMVSEEGFPVELVSGAITKVQTEAEVDYVADKVARYTEHNSFFNISDIQDVDRMIMLELQVFRSANYLNRGGRNYLGDPVDEAEHRRAMAGFSNEIRQTKKILGIDKAARDHERGENSLPNYIAKLIQRALEFCIHRDNQNAIVLELGMQLIALAQYHHNTNEEERREMHITLQDLYEWIMDYFTPRLMECDAHFRENQKMWVQDL